VSEAVQIRKGLEGVVVDTTRLSLVDGEAGRLYYLGFPIESLVGRRFAEVAHLIVFGELPDAPRLAQFEEFLWQAGQLPPALRALLQGLAAGAHHPMAALQAIAPLLGQSPPAEAMGRTAEEQQGLLAAARLPEAIAIIHARGGAVAYPQSRRYGERYLQLLGRTPVQEQVAAFECLQILQLDHGFNASTFAARVVTSTLAPPASAISAALGALYGPLHGAADQGALEMALEVGDPARASDFVASCLANGRIVMGMGHREYRVLDPRARIIRGMAERIAIDPALRRIFETLSAVDEAFVAQTRTRRRTLRANLEFYKGVVCLSLGIPKELFTATFAASRVFGWVAHIIEQRKDNRIIRPAAHYEGPPPRPLEAALA